MEPGFQVSVISRTGGRERNEDACGYWTGASSAFACYVLADGAGGHGGGDVASQLVVETVLDRYAHHPVATRDDVLDLLSKANNAVISAQASDRRLADMRSTAVLLEIDARRQCAFWGHVGDSRLYCFDQGRLVHRTKDHSLVQGMLDAGLLHNSNSLSALDRNVLTGSLGAIDSFSPEVLEEPYPIVDGNAFLLCSDGFWSAFSDATIESMLQGSASPESWLNTMEQSLSAKLGPGADNYSAIAIWFTDHRSRFADHRGHADNR